MKVGINGAVRDISDLKVGVSGAVRAVSEAYIGVAGATKKVWPNKKALNDCTWDEISEISSSGQAANYFAVGDCKEIVLNGTVGALTFEDYHTYAYIIGINHNAAVEGNNLIHFQLAMTALEGGANVCFVDEHHEMNNIKTGFVMNQTATTVGGWEDSYMRNNICGTSKTSTSGRFMGAIPSALRNALKSVTKYTDNTGGGRGNSASYVTPTTDYIFLLSEYEVFGEIGTGNTYEANYQQQYAYYSGGNSKVKHMHDGADFPARWWLRSPRATSSSAFRLVTIEGGVSNTSAYYSLGFAPCFCV